MSRDFTASPRDSEAAQTLILPIIPRAVCKPQLSFQKDYFPFARRSGHTRGVAVGCEIPNLPVQSSFRALPNIG